MSRREKKRRPLNMTICFYQDQLQGYQYHDRFFHLCLLLSTLPPLSSLSSLSSLSLISLSSLSLPSPSLLPSLLRSKYLHFSDQFLDACDVSFLRLNISNKPEKKERKKRGRERKGGRWGEGKEEEERGGR